MMKNKVVVFLKNNARVITNPESLDTFKDMENALINPTFKNVKGIPPHFWKIVRGELHSMGEAEQKERLKAIKREGIDNFLRIGKAPPREIIKKEFIWDNEILFVVGCFTASLGVIAGMFLHSVI